MTEIKRNDDGMAYVVVSGHLPEMNADSGDVLPAQQIDNHVFVSLAQILNTICTIIERSVPGDSMMMARPEEMSDALMGILTAIDIYSCLGQEAEFAAELEAWNGKA